MDSVDEKYLCQLYYNPKHSTAFSSASKLWQYVRLCGRDIIKTNFMSGLVNRMCIHLIIQSYTVLQEEE